MNQRLQLDGGFAAHVQRAHALRPVHLVRRKADHVDRHGLYIERHFAGALRRVDVKQRSRRAAYFADSGHVVDDANLVVDLHQRHHQRIGPYRLTDLFRRDDTVLPWDQVGHLETLVLQVMAGIEDRLVFDGAGHDVAPARALGNALDGKVVRFRRAGGPNNLTRIGIDQPRNLGSREFDGFFRLPAVVV